MPPNITEDDFAAWRDHPVTKWVFDSLTIVAEAQREHRMEVSWGTGTAPPEMLLELRTRQDAYRAIIDVEYARLCEVHQGAEDDTPT